MSPEQQKQLNSFAHQAHSSLLSLAASPQEDLVSALLDGGATRTINAMLGRERRRDDGIFFSGPQWAARLRQALPHGPFLRYVDPSCGVGDLLIEIASHLPLSASLDGTLEDWSQRFRGIDLHAPLARVAWSRLQALAIRRHGSSDINTNTLNKESETFESLDALEANWSLRSGDCLLMNPPFQSVMSPSWSLCCGGRVTAAALFLERAITDAPAGTTIAALLPEVIRSGSRFARLRRLIAERSTIHEFSAQGLFSNEADIDVAILCVTAGQPLNEYRQVEKIASQPKTLGDLAKLSIGPIVPHRNSRGRTWRPYLDVEGAPVWKEVKVSTMERYLGRTVMPPFVVVRRTSSPSDRQRARATLIRGRTPILVENHLVVLAPKTRSLDQCRKMMRILADDRTSIWLNQMLRCRHLTKSVLTQLPAWDED